MSNKIVDISGLERFLTNIKSYFEEIFSNKQDVIEDLDNIRANAAKGATALQKHQDISGKLDKTEAADTYAAKNDLTELSLNVQENERVTASVISDIYDKIENIDIAGSVDLTAYATKSELNTGLGTKQDNLVSGTNIKTINGASILGNGDIEIKSGDGDVEYINPTYNANSECLEYRIPPGKSYELNMHSFDYSIITGNVNFIGIIFENPAEVTYMYDETTHASTLIGENNYSKYHFIYWSYGYPVSFAFDGGNDFLDVNEIYMYSSSGEWPTPNESCFFEMDALCHIENMVYTDNSSLRNGVIIASSVNNAPVELL